jgi:hypothetical protein
VAVALIGNPFDAWVMLMSLATGHFDTDFGTLLLGFPLYVVASGVAPATGIASIAGVFPDDPVFVGLELNFQAVSGDQLTNLVTMTVF